MIKFRQKDFSKVTLRPIKLKRKLITGVGKTGKKVKLEMNKAALNPGKYTSDTAQFVIENPVASTGIVAGYSAIPIPGTTAGSLALENAAKRIPIYKKATSSLGNIYRKSGINRIIEPVVNAGYNSVKIMSGAY